MSKPICFFLSPIGEPDSPERKNSDDVIEYILKPVLVETYQIIRADQISKSGLITHQIINCIIDSQLVIADLTGSNANVFYELAIRHALRKPVIQIISQGYRVPFDVGNHRTIDYSLHVGEVGKATTELSQYVKAIDSGELVENPISTVFDLNIMKTNGNPQEKVIANISDALTSIQDSLAVLHNAIGGIRNIQGTSVISSRPNLFALGDAPLGINYATGMDRYSGGGGFGGGGGGFGSPPMPPKSNS